MAKTGVFKLTGPRKGQTVQLMHYYFKDGELRVPEHDALKMATNLCEYYGCELTWETDVADIKSDESSSDSSLAKTNTKVGTSKAVQPVIDEDHDK